MNVIPQSPPKIFDTHAHYDDEAFQEDRQELLSSLPSYGIQRIVNIGANIQTCAKTIQLMTQYDFIYGALGVHPSETAELNETNFAWLKKQCLLEKCVAVGEIGLDYYWEKPDHPIQKEWFIRQLALAKELKLPVVIHSRDAAKDTLDILTTEKAGDIGGVIHCYSYTKESARQFLDMDFYFGIGGVLTFKNAKKLREAAEYIPLEKIVLETDCPYLSPEPNRGKRNSSLNLPFVADVLAQIKGVSIEEIYEKTWENGCKLYQFSKEENSDKYHSLL